MIRTLAILKVQSFLKKMKTESKWSYKLRQNSCSKYIPLERTAPDSELDKQTKNRQTPHFHTYSWRASFDPPPQKKKTLHGGRTRRAHTSAREQNADFWPLSKRPSRRPAGKQQQQQQQQQRKPRQHSPVIRIIIPDNNPNDSK